MSTITFYRVHLRTKSRRKLRQEPLVWRSVRGTATEFFADVGLYRSIEEADAAARRLAEPGVSSTVVAHSYST
jgi:hypothetical protein